VKATEGRLNGGNYESLIMKVYGASICGDCRNFKALAEEKHIEHEYVDITASTANLREFLGLRDSLPMYDAVRARGGIGIPLFEQDGKYTLELEEALGWIGLTIEKPEETCDFCK